MVDLSRFSIEPPTGAPAAIPSNFTIEPPGAADAKLGAARDATAQQSVSAAEQEPNFAESLFGMPAGSGDALHTIISGIVHGTLKAGSDMFSRVTGQGADQPTPGIDSLVGHAPSTPAGQVGMQPLADLSAGAAAMGNTGLSNVNKKWGPTVADIVRQAAGVGGDVSQLAPVAGATGVAGDIGGAARAALRAPAMDTGGVPALADVMKAAGYTGLKAKGDMTLPGPAAITNRLISQDINLPPNTAPNVTTVTKARNAGPGATMTAAQRALEVPLPPAPGELPGAPPVMTPLTADPQLHTDISNIDASTSQLPRPPDIAGLKAKMLGQPTMTPSELFSNMEDARFKAGRILSSQASSPEQMDLGDAYNKIGDAYEGFAGRQLDAARAAGGTGPSSADVASAGKQFAQSYLAQGALHGGSNFDPAVYARMAEKNPGLLTDNGAVVGHIHNNLPSVTQSQSLSGPVAGTVGAAAGEMIGGATGHPILGPLAGTAVGLGSAKMKNVLDNLFTRGNPAAAASASTNPVLDMFRRPVPVAAPPVAPVPVAAPLGAQFGSGA